MILIDLYFGEAGEWNAFVKAQTKQDNFLQSYEWGQFQSSVARDAFYLQAKQNDIVLAQFMVVKRKLVFGFYSLYIPRGPIFRQGLQEHEKKEVISAFLNWVEKNLLKTVYIDIDYFLVSEDELEELGFVKQDNPLQPQQTLFLDLSLSEEELMGQMKSKTRYNIRVAEKHGVYVKKGSEKEDLNAFLSLLDETSLRQAFGIHSHHYYEKMLEQLGKIGIVSVYTAYFNEVPIASNLMIDWGDTTTYLHGGSHYDYRKYMAPHLLQWHQILDAKEKGRKWYDFWGVASIGNRVEKWEGITRFKSGYAPSKSFTSYGHGFRKITLPSIYSLYFVYKLMRKVV